MEKWVAGSHLVIDLYNCKYHGSLEEIQAMMEDACKATGATLLFTHLHPFDGGGVTGVCVLAESHMTIHTWPEKNYVAADIFVCGNCDPNKVISFLSNHFKTSSYDICGFDRGYYPILNKSEELHKRFFG